jgi:hypothetical protein
MKRILISVLILGLGCTTPFYGGRTLKDGPVQFQTILTGSHSLADTAYVQLITSDRDWERAWLTARGRVDPLPARPTVDFNRHFVIAAFMGRRPSSGFHIEITSLEKQGAVLNVNVTNYETPGMLTVVTSPFTLIRVPRGDYRLNVNEETVQ